MARYDNFGSLDTPMVDETDSFFLKMNGRLRPDQLKSGQLAYSQNGRMDVNGAWQPRKGVTTIGTQPGTASQALVIPWYIRAGKVIDQAARVTTLVTIRTTAAHLLSNSDKINISDISGTFDPTGNRTITVTDSTHFTFVITGATGSETYTLGSSPAFTTAIIAATNGAWGSCRFSDPRNSNGEYIIRALYAGAEAINLTTAAVTTLTYPTGVTVSSPVEMIQAFDKVYIFRTNLTAIYWDGIISGGLAFAKVSRGAFTQPIVLTTANNAAASAGVVTITNTHNLAVGALVTIMDEGTTGLVRGDVYTVATISTTVSFTFYASVDDFTSTSVVLGFKQSSGKGYTFMPAPAWGVYHQRRLIVPFSNTLSSTETITTRNITDEVIFSDVLDGDTYDILQNEFRLTGGIADFTQTVHPFTNDAAVGFNRRSIHLITGLSGSLTDVTIQEITKEAGLVARNSVVTIGNSIYFLSDNGVYATNFGDLYNLRGAGLPLSDPINPLIQRINAAYAYRAVGIFHNNRYYLAVPLDTSITNNAIFVYNVLNEGWESVDIITTAGWDIANLIVGAPSGINQLFSVNSNGGIHILESRSDDRDLIFTYPGISATSYFIDASALSRQYTFQTSERKKFNSIEIQVESTDTNTSDAEINGVFENLDSDVAIGTIAGIMGANLAVSEDASLRARIGNIRSYGGQIEFVPTAGRPILRLIKITAAPTFRALTAAS